MCLRTRAVVFARSPARAAADPAAQPGAAGPPDRTRQGAVVLALLIAVVVLDQAVKWWAWRHVSWTRINSGGDALVGRTIGAWFAGPVTGALLDAADFGLLSVAAWALARCRATRRRRRSRRPDGRRLGQQPARPAGNPRLDRPWQRPRRGRFHAPRRALLQRRGLLHHRLHAAIPAGSRIPGRAGGQAGSRGRERGPSPALQPARARIPAAAYRETGPRTEQALGWSHAGCDNA